MGWERTGWDGVVKGIDNGLCWVGLHDMHAWACTYISTYVCICIYIYTHRFKTSMFLYIYMYLYVQTWNVDGNIESPRRCLRYCIYIYREREREGICVRLTVRVEITHQLVDIPELPILHYLPCSGQEAGNNRSASCPYACLLRQPYGATWGILIFRLFSGKLSIIYFALLADKRRPLLKQHSKSVSNQVAKYTVYLDR